MGMDPKLQRRLQQQQEKEEKGESAVEQVVEGGSKNSVGLDPKLAKRLAQQQAKAATGEGIAEPILGSTKNSVGLDPKLAKRLAQQQAKADDGASPVRVKWETQLDPVLARRLAKQKEKEENGESAIDLATNGIKNSVGLDPKLARRLAEQQEKESSGECAPEETKVPTPQRCRLTRAGFATEESELGKRLSTQRKKVEDVAEESEESEETELPDDDNEPEKAATEAPIATAAMPGTADAVAWTAEQRPDSAAHARTPRAASATRGSSRARPSTSLCSGSLAGAVLALNAAALIAMASEGWLGQDLLQSTIWF